MKVSRPHIFEYTDFRVYLNDLFAASKKALPHFSHRYLARIAGFSSPNFLYLVMQGKRNLSAESMEKVCKAFKLSAAEEKYFRFLVLREQAETPEERDFFLRQLLKKSILRKLKPLSQEQYDYYSEWYHVVLRELVARVDFKEDPEWIASQLHPSISAAEAKEGIERLIKLGLLKRDRNKKLIQTDTIISSGDDVVSEAVKSHHRHMIKLGVESIERFSPEDRDVSALTLGLSEEGEKNVRDLVRRFRKDLLVLAETDKKVTRVMQINFQLFPLTKKVDSDE